MLRPLSRKPCTMRYVCSCPLKLLALMEPVRFFMSSDWKSWSVLCSLEQQHVVSEALVRKRTHRDEWQETPTDLTIFKTG